MRSIKFALRTGVWLGLLMTCSLTLTGCEQKAELPIPVELPTTWQYTSSPDKMRGTEWHAAHKYSNNAIPPNYPYEGGKVELDVSQLGTSIRADTQFICYDHTRIAVKFDDMPVEQFMCSQPENGTGQLLWISHLIDNSESLEYDPTSNFDYKVIRAKKVIIELPTHGGGLHQIEFDVTGLDKSKIWRKDEKGIVYHLK